MFVCCARCWQGCTAGICGYCEESPPVIECPHRGFFFQFERWWHAVALRERAAMTDAVPRLAGVLPVFQTPYHDDETIDYDTLSREVDWLLDCGGDGVVMAMVSETLRLSTDERREMAAHVCRVAAGRGAVVISVGAESRHTTLGLARHAAECGATALMAIPPIATAAPADEVLGYYRGYCGGN